MRIFLFKRLFLLSLFFFCCYFLIAQNNRAKSKNRQNNYPTAEQWNAILQSFSIIPLNLQDFEASLDYDVLARHCYKFIYNIDSTKFLAFFNVNSTDKSYDTVIQNGMAVTLDKSGADKYTNVYYGYILWGMKYNNQWYFHKDAEVLYFDKNDSTARLDYLHHTLRKKEYWKNWGTDNYDFWGSNIFKNRTKESDFGDFIGHPEIVGWSKISELGRLRKRVLQLVNKDLDSLKWKSNNAFDSLITRKNENIIFYVTNWDRNLVLAPIVVRKGYDRYCIFIFYDLRAKEVKQYLWLNKMFQLSPQEKSVVTTIEKNLGLLGVKWTHMSQTVDSIFWNNHVLKQVDENFIYLRPF